MSSLQNQRYPRERSMSKVFLETVGLARKVSSSFLRRMQSTQVTVLDMKLARKVSSSFLRRIQPTHRSVLDMKSACQTGRNPGTYTRN